MQFDQGQLTEREYKERQKPLLQALLDGNGEPSVEQPSPKVAPHA
jgi:hypothetical protein